MIASLHKILVLCAVTIRVLGREVCTFVKETETEGSPSDWQGSMSVRDLLQCKEFCTSTPGCTAAELSSTRHSCVLYKGPTTRRRNTHNTFIHRICKEVTSAGSSTTSTPTNNLTTTTPTDATVNQVIRVTSASHVKEEEDGKTDKDKGKERFRRASSTEPAPEPTVTRVTTLRKHTDPGVTRVSKRKHRLSRRKSKSRAPAALVVKMLYESSTASESVATKEQSTTSFTSTEQPTPETTKIIRKLSRYQKSKGRRRKHKMKFIPKFNKGAKDSRLITTPSWRVTEKSTVDITNAYGTTQKSPDLVKISKSIELNIPDTVESLQIKPDNERKPETLVRVHMRTSRYRKVVAPQVEQDNRVAVQGGSGDTSMGRNCQTLCTPTHGVQHTRRGLYIPLMRIHIPFMMPYHGFQRHHSRFHPSNRFKLPVRQVFSRVPQMSYPQWHLPRRQPQWQQPLRQPQWQQSLRKPHWQQPMWQPQRQQPMKQHQWQQPLRQPQRQQPISGHRQWRQLHWRGTPWQQSQWRQPYNSRLPQWRQRQDAGRGIGPQHAAVAYYGGQRNPWENNFHRASLRAPRTHQVAVIPGGRARPLVPQQRAQTKGYWQTSAPITTTAATTEPTTHTVSEYDRSTAKQSGSNANFKYAVQNDKLNDEKVSHRHNTETDERWKLKSHYNTYLLRLNLPLPITGHKVCYLRQQLPPPPKIIVISFKPDGSFKARSLPVHYPRRTCTFVRPGAGPPELHLPVPLVIFTGARFASGKTELRGIYNATAPKAEYAVEDVQKKATMYRYTAVFNAAAVFRKLDLPINMVSAVVGFDSARMGFIYRFNVRLPRVLSSRNIMLQDQLPANMLHVKIGPKPYGQNSK